MKLILPELNYNYDSLEPIISKEIMELHHQKHHATYIKNFNDEILKINNSKFLELDESDLYKNINTISHLPNFLKIKNNLGGHINHSLFWKILSPDKIEITENFKNIIEKKFQSFDNFKKIFIESAMNHFGSGWTFLIFNKILSELQILNFNNQDSPYYISCEPLFGIDLWEHAYYIQYKNKKLDYLENIFNLINWIEVEKKYFDLF